MARKEVKKKKPENNTTKRPNSRKKTGRRTQSNSFQNQNLVALFLLIFGMVSLLSITTNALGAVGVAIKSVLLGQFGGIATLTSVVMIVAGAARLVYSSKFELNSIPIMLPILSLFATTTFYGAINLAKYRDIAPSFESLKMIFVMSVVGKNIGIFPYLMSYALFSMIGRTGMFLVSFFIFLFVVIYYFKISFSKLGDASIALVTEGKRVASGLKKKTMDYITVDDETEELNRPKPKISDREKLDETFIEQKYGFLERYKSEIAEFTEFGSGDLSKESPEAFENSQEQFNQQAKSDMENEIRISWADEEKRDLEDTTFEESSPERISEHAVLPIGGRFNIAEADSTGDFGGETKIFRSLAEEIRVAEQQQELRESENIGKEVEKSAMSIESPKSVVEQDFEIVDKRLVHQKDQLEKENISALATLDQAQPVASPSKKYILPSTTLLKNYKIKQKEQSQQLKDAQKLESTLQIFGIEAKVVNIAIGPTITRYELSLKVGTKVSRILNLSDDLALALAAVAPIRIEAPIPGTSLIGIELPNAETDIVSFRAMLETEVFQNSKAKLPVALGKDVSGKAIIADIAKMPHVLVAGATGSGKSVCINTLICSILFKSKPDEVKLIMIDPKMVELSVYNEIPHLLVPVVTDMKKAPYALSWAVSEMNKRYKLFAENRVRDLDGYNAIPDIEKMPRIVIVVDELADLMMVSPNEVEDSIIRLAQKARACGMHLVIATQRPSVDVITGLIKANIPTRIAFAVSSQVDSRTILDQVGAEKLIGKGDMLFSHPSVAKPQRIQGALILDDEVNAVVDFILKQGHHAPQNEDLIEEEIHNVESAKEEEDPLLDEILEFAVQNKQISTSLIQRRFRIGYNRASRIIDRLEELGAVSESDGAKPRKVLINSAKELNRKQEEE